MTAPATSPTGLLPARAEYELIASATATPSTARDSSIVRVISFLLLTSTLMSYHTTSRPARLLRPSGPAQHRAHPTCMCRAGISTHMRGRGGGRAPAPSAHRA